MVRRCDIEEIEVCPDAWLANGVWVATRWGQWSLVRSESAYKAMVSTEGDTEELREEAKRWAPMLKEMVEKEIDEALREMVSARLDRYREHSDSG